MHRSSKNLYDRTNKKNAVQQICNMEGRQRLVNTAKQAMDTLSAAELNEPSAEMDPLDVLDYQISLSKKSPIDLYHWVLQMNKNDPSFQHFLPNLRKHIVTRLGRGSDVTKILFKGNRIYQHSVLKLYYDTYDLQRGYHSVNPKSRRDVMILSKTGYRPYDYARVKGIFHVEAAYRDSSDHLEYSLIQFMWVRNFEDISEDVGPFEKKRLTTLELCDHKDPNAFRFLDPSEIVRAVHLIPAFSSHEKSNLGVDEWQLFNIGLFADRDSVMRSRGGGIGHTTTRQFDEQLLSDGIRRRREEPQDEDDDDDDDDEVDPSLFSGPNLEEDNEDDDCSEGEGEVEDDEEYDEDDIEDDTNIDPSSDEDAAHESDDDCQFGFADL